MRTHNPSNGLPIVLDYRAPDRTPRNGTGVIIVLGILLLPLLAIFAISIAIPRPKPVGGKVGSVRADVNMFETAIDLFETDCGRYPTSSEGLGALLDPPPSTPGWNGPYVKRIPMDQWGSPYIYIIPGTKSKASYDLSSSGPDGKPGTADDIANW